MIKGQAPSNPLALAPLILRIWEIRELLSLKKERNGGSRGLSKLTGIKIFFLETAKKLEFRPSAHPPTDLLFTPHCWSSPTPGTNYWEDDYLVQSYTEQKWTWPSVLHFPVWESMRAFMAHPPKTRLQETWKWNAVTKLKALRNKRNRNYKNGKEYEKQFPSSSFSLHVMLSLWQ